MSNNLIKKLHETTLLSQYLQFSIADSTLQNEMSSQLVLPAAATEVLCSVLCLTPSLAPDLWTWPDPVS